MRNDEVMIKKYFQPQRFKFLGFFYIREIDMKKLILFSVLLMIFSLLAADPPNWEQIGGTQFSMLLRAQITHNGNLFEGINPANIIAAFGPGGEDDCRDIGFWINANPPLYENGFWDIGIVSNQYEDEVITFKIYDVDTDSIISCCQEIVFEDGKYNIGSLTGIREKFIPVVTSSAKTSISEIIIF